MNVSPIFWPLFYNPQHRREVLRSGWNSAGQISMQGSQRVLSSEALVVAFILANLNSLFKGTVNRLTSEKEVVEMNPDTNATTQHGRQQTTISTTDLAMERNYLAAERTLMAWIRTALSMISFGFTIGKLGQVLKEVEFKGLLGNTRTMSIDRIAHFLVVLGTVALLGAAIQHWYRVRELRVLGLKRKFSIGFIVALLLVAIGGLALTSLVLAI